MSPPRLTRVLSPLEEEIVHWPCPLIDRFSGLLRKIKLLWAYITPVCLLSAIGLHAIFNVITLVD